MLEKGKAKPSARDAAALGASASIARAQAGLRAPSPGHPSVVGGWELARTLAGSAGMRRVHTVPLCTGDSARIVRGGRIGRVGEALLCLPRISGSTRGRRSSEIGISRTLDRAAPRAPAPWGGRGSTFRGPAALLPFADGSCVETWMVWVEAHTGVLDVSMRRVEDEREQLGEK